MGKNAAKITLTSRQSGVLEPLARSRTAPQRLVERCRIVLMSAEGRDNEDQVRSWVSTDSGFGAGVAGGRAPAVP